MVIILMYAPIRGHLDPLDLLLFIVEFFDSLREREYY